MRGKALSVTESAAQNIAELGGAYFAFGRNALVDKVWIQTESASYAAIYAKQPAVRTVVDYIGRIAADRGLRLYVRTAQGESEEITAHAAAATIRTPNDWQGTKRMLGQVVRDILVYDNAYLWDMGPDEGGRRMLVRVPAYAIGPRGGTALVPQGYRVIFWDGTWLDLDPTDVIHFRGYSALDGRRGDPPLATLRDLVVEEAVRQTQAIEWVKGGMVKGGVVQRPDGAPEWSDAARERFEESWAGRLKGVQAGHTPVLEEGMVFIDAGVTPREAEAISHRELSLATVARMYGLHPEIFGTSPSGGRVLFADIRSSAEQDVIVPLLGLVAEDFTRQLVHGRYGDEDHWFEFDPRAEGDVASLFAAGKAATQGPVMTINEFRRRFLNLPPVPDGDALVMNPGTMGFQLGGEPPQDAANPDRGRPPKAAADRTKAIVRRQAQANRRDRYAADIAEALRAHFRRQQRALGKATRLDSARWDSELADDVGRISARVVSEEGLVQATRLAGSFDAGQTENYVQAGAKAFAAAVNSATANDARAYREAGDDDPTSKALEQAVQVRSDRLALGKATALTSFAAREAAKQNEPETRLKTWVGSGLPDSRHTDVSGESVSLDQAFSNGLQYPGDPAGDPADTAGCQCNLDVG